MKLSKILLGAVAGAAVLGLVSCGGNDDPNAMIKGANKKYTIDYENDTADVSRGYKRTALQHAGALVKLTFNEIGQTAGATTNVYGGVLGCIFDLHTNDNGGKDFSVVGIQNKNGVIKSYVSTYTGVTNLQAYNFGASTAADATEGTEETVIQDFTVVSSSKIDTTDGANAVYVYFCETATSDTDYDYNVYILPKSVVDTLANIKDADAGALRNTDGDIVDISSYKIATCDTSYTSLKQNNFAPYANVYAYSSVSGEWNIQSTYKEAEVIE